MAKSFLHYNRMDPAEKLFARIQSLTADQLFDVANDMFAPERISTLVYR
jgi:predicted Zn-dependent peptidase